MARASAQYLAAGANRHPSTADWDASGLLAFGADRNVALWRPQNVYSQGVSELLSGHTDIVNAVKFIPNSNGLLISGGVDKTLRIWSEDSSTKQYSCLQTLSKHQNSINSIAVSTGALKIFASGAADATVKVWILDDQNLATLRQTIDITPRFFPLALALIPLTGAPESYVLAVAGTKDIIQLYILDSQKSQDFKFQATLSGHEGWIRSLEFIKECPGADSDLILSSASQDKYIRLWRLHQGVELPVAAASQDQSLGAYMPGKSLSNRAHRFQAQGLDFSATFEALLLGHEDWIYSTKWRSSEKGLQLLSASADNSLAIWESHIETGVWVTVTRLGEISAEKGSTTATGSTGGFWTGLWSPDGSTVISLGRTGSWRLWNHSISDDSWLQGIGISGHTLPITGIAWSRNGDYLLSTSSDQTTRLHSKWKRFNADGMKCESWHEMARPQIHGYDLNCIDSLGKAQFVSGADEKLLRVFSEPRTVANLLSKLCGIGEGGDVESMPDAANMPVLGLSNKAIEVIADDAEPELLVADNKNKHNAIDPASIIHKSALDLDKPTSEEHLSRHTLWPEIEKLYGHGYEISCLASSHDGSIIATACKASSIDHAVVRLFETKTWHEVKPPLTAHSLTVTRLRFSVDDNYLLSVGRDRHWTIFERSELNEYKLLEANTKGHSRMILDAAWAPWEPSLSPTQHAFVFATAGRDKQVKIWVKAAGEKGFTCKTMIVEEHPVTAIDFLDVVLDDKNVYLAVGTETGRIKIYLVDLINESYEAKEIDVGYQSAYPYPSKAITKLVWKPTGRNKGRDWAVKKELELAIASEDSSLRVYSIGLP